MPTLTEYISKMNLEEHENVIDFSRDIAKEINGFIDDGEDRNTLGNTNEAAMNNANKVNVNANTNSTKTNINHESDENNENNAHNANVHAITGPSPVFKYIYRPQYLREEASKPEPKETKPINRQPLKTQLTLKTDFSRSEVEEPRTYDLHRDAAHIARISGGSKSISHIEDIIEPTRWEYPRNNPNGLRRRNGAASAGLERSNRMGTERGFERLSTERANPERMSIDRNFERPTERPIERPLPFDQERTSPAALRDNKNRRSWNNYEHGITAFYSENGEVDSPITRRQRLKRRSLTPDLMATLSTNPSPMISRHVSTEHRKKPETISRSPSYTSRLLSHNRSQSLISEDIRNDLKPGINKAGSPLDDKNSWAAKRKVIQELQLDYMLMKRTLKALEERMDIFEKIHTHLDLTGILDSKDACTQVSSLESEGLDPKVVKRIEELKGGWAEVKTKEEPNEVVAGAETGSGLGSGSRESGPGEAEESLAAALKRSKEIEDELIQRRKELARVLDPNTSGEELGIKSRKGRWLIRMPQPRTAPTFVPLPLRPMWIFVNNHRAIFIVIVLAILFMCV